MNVKSKQLLEEAYLYADQLSKHTILSHYWNQLSLVLKGSVSRGNSDQYSDIDFVFFCDENVRQTIIKAYKEAGLVDREDGVFLPINEWAGHYHFESFDMLNQYHAKNNRPQMWEYGHAIAIHDPLQRYKSTLTQLTHQASHTFIDDIRTTYLDTQLALDWMRHPLKRGDVISASLHATTIIRKLCQLCYLVDLKNYPHDKWLSHYLNQTTLGSMIEQDMITYLKCLPTAETLLPNLELEDYPCYGQAKKLVEQCGSYLLEKFGDHPWIKEWYLHT
ncbi:nucleotidyltransferase domain-containing protein [Paenibacillus sp. N1-5-1-14]|uniref:nucleotidyltransferase domain-containing protein n=1 Tax=Paenibacillus radicibacter TaxID=2972488 RepID=UPI002158E3D3|nr:nucleotidyltransferase domain-containing protein [Paenibacillus radicibacter]MCR8641220.1 nucleotidyltransferase domain-containing protein [Paenibacillus radicibacter]